MKSIYEQIGGTYSLGEEGIYYPDLTPPKEETSCYGKYGILRREFLKEHRRGLYSALLMSGKLVTHLNEIEEIANNRIEMLMQKMKKEQNITEELKAQDQLAWVAAMNNILNAAEEIVLKEIVYEW